MRFVIWKFDLTDNATFEMPKGAKILTVQVQRAGAESNRVQLWAECDPNQLEKEKRVFMVVPTGVPFDQIEKRYVATFQDGWFVGHVYELL